MRRLVSVLAALLCGLTLAAPSASADDRIVGGSTVDIDTVPWTLSLQYDGYHYCGATIVAERVAITAAHCTEDVPVSRMSVRAGSSKHASGGVRVRVRAVEQHPLFNPDTLDYDIAVLTLADRVGINGRTIAAAEVADTAPAVRTQVRVAGWGVTREQGDIPDRLHAVKVPTVSREACRESYGTTAITSRMLCAGLTEGGKDSCQGDSGGPLTEDATLVGVVSWGNGCARANYYGVYTNVSQPVIREWIEDTAGV